MKKFLTLLMILTFLAGINLQASKPIPSHKVKVSRVENFQEKNQTGDYLNYGEKGRRYMMVVAQVAGPSKSPVTIWVYSLDGRDIMGPFMLADGESFSVAIDERLWGVILQCADKCSASVWTSTDPGGFDPAGIENL